MYFVFHPDQVAKAIDKYAGRVSSSYEKQVETRELLRDFLTSPEAVTNKLVQGDVEQIPEAEQ